MLHQQKLPFLNAEYTGQYEHMLPSMEWFYAHCKAVTYVCAYSALTMLPGSVKTMYGKGCRPQHLWIFSLHSSFLHVLTGSGDCQKELLLFIFILKYQRWLLSRCLYYISSIVII